MKFQTIVWRYSGSPKSQASFPLVAKKYPQLLLGGGSFLKGRVSVWSLDF